MRECVVAFGGIEMKDERQTVTIPAEFIIRAQKLYRENGELTGEEEAVNKYIPVQLIYDPN